MKIIKLIIVLLFLTIGSFSQKLDTLNYIYYEHEDFYIAFDKNKCDYNCDAEYDTNFSLIGSSFTFPYGFSFKDILILPKNNLIINTQFSGDLFIGTDGSETEGPYPYENFLTDDLGFSGNDSIVRDSIHSNRERFKTVSFSSFNSFIYNYRYNIDNIVIDPVDLNSNKFNDFIDWYKSIILSKEDEKVNYYIDGFWLDITYNKDGEQYIYKVYFPYIYAEC